mmetsp:Transcript_133036/g.370871  ORF Transcript_133036/g.370871 Transcript_133036/m.370871 type:complete len:287 (+) Transcript_133036:588-1448(+)
MAWVARWSATIVWNSAFSASRFSLAFLISTSVATICALASAISFCSLAMRAASVSSLDSRSPLYSFLPYVAFSFSSNCLLQYALNSASSFCCSLSSATIVSIILFTSVKESSCAARAKAESWARGPPAAPTAGVPRRLCQASRRSSASKAGSAAARRNASTACMRRAAVAALALEAALARSCSRLTLLASISRLSSSVRIAMASVTAFSSSLRIALRRSQSLSKSIQVTFNLRKISMSAERCFRVRSRSSLASDSAFWFSEWSPSMSSSFSFPAVICAVFASASAW